MQLSNLDGPSIENSKRPHPLDSDEEDPQNRGKFMKKPNKPIRKVLIVSGYRCI